MDLSGLFMETFLKVLNKFILTSKSIFIHLCLNIWVIIWINFYFKTQKFINLALKYCKKSIFYILKLHSVLFCQQFIFFITHCIDAVIKKRGVVNAHILLYWFF